MKLTLLLLIISLHVSATASSQKVTLNYKDASLREVLKSIRKQSGYGFAISDALLSYAKPVTINLKSSPIEETLQILFSNQPLTYRFQAQTIVIEFKVIETTTLAEPSFVQERDISGMVTDEKGSPLPGATVILKGTNKGTATDKDGRFMIPNAPDNGKLLIRMIGHETTEIAYKNGNLKSIVLKEINADLNTVQVIAYGEVTKKFSTSNIGTITAKEIGNQPVTNPLLALQGRVPGLFINQTSGVTSSAVNTNIQGLNSLRLEANAPLFVIDGVPYNPTFPGGNLMGQAIVTGDQGSPSTFNFINPADIESISVLKDADATAVYGSRAANGAILITTKRGKAGKTIFNITGRNGWGHIDQRLKLMNTQQYLSMRKEAYFNAGKKLPTNPTEFDYSNADLAVWDQNRYTDWQKELANGTALFTDIQTSISGGTVSTQFLVGYNYNRQSTVYPDGKADIKGNIHFNINHNSKDTRFKYFLTGTYLQDKNQLNSTDLMADAINLAPNAPVLHNPDGSINFGLIPGRPDVFASFNNPLTYTLRNFVGNTSNLIGNNTISYEIIPGLQIKSSMGYNKLQGSETTIIPGTIYPPLYLAKTRSAQYLTKTASTWIIEPQLIYVKESNVGRFDLLLGGTFQQTKNDALTQSGRGYANDEQLENLQSATTVTINNVLQTLYKYNAFFGRLNYRLNNKYILNLTARRDGSSRFGENRKFSNFYAIGTAWLFGNEKFVKDLIPWLNFGKMRVNYGITGNDQIADYGYLSSVDIFGVDIPYQDVISLIPGIISNPFLQWEETKKLNIGIDLGFLENRIELGLNWYNNRSSNQLIGTDLPFTTGFGTILQNFPATVQNTGIEVQFDVHAIKKEHFNWHSSLNFTKSKNELIEYKDLINSTAANTYIIGKPINIQRVYKYAGVSPKTGLYEVFNSKGERTSNPDPTTDKTVLIDPNPNFYGGFVNSFQYKGFELEVLFQFVKQKGINYRFGIKPPGFSSNNQPIVILNQWKKEGDIKNVQKFSADYNEVGQAFNAANQSDAIYSDASYIRLKNLSVSYSLPKQLLHRIKISNFRVYLQGQNLLTITNYIGADPETRSILALPPLRVYTIGLQLDI